MCWSCFIWFLFCESLNVCKSYSRVGSHVCFRVHESCSFSFSHMPSSGCCAIQQWPRLTASLHRACNRKVVSRGNGPSHLLRGRRWGHLLIDDARADVHRECERLTRRHPSSSSATWPKRILTERGLTKEDFACSRNCMYMTNCSCLFPYSLGRLTCQIAGCFESMIWALVHLFARVYLMHISCICSGVCSDACSFACSCVCLFTIFLQVPNSDSCDASWVSSPFMMFLFH